jgi:hypothetical protein
MTRVLELFAGNTSSGKQFILYFCDTEWSSKSPDPRGDSICDTDAIQS